MRRVERSDFRLPVIINTSKIRVLRRPVKSALDASIYVMKGDQTFPLWREGGKAVVPEALELTFNYDPQRNPRVGKWQADFVTPEHDVTEAWLHMPNVAPIGPFKIQRR